MQNSIMFQGFEWYCPDDGGFYRWMMTEIEKYQVIGITSIWLPPMSKATSNQDVGYGIYDYYDLGEFEQKGSVRTKYGTKAELLALINKAHDLGLRVYADIILNHKADADATERFEVVKVNPENRLEIISDPFEIEGYTAFTFPGRNGQYSQFQWNFNHFSGVDFDNKTGKTAIYKILGENKDWSQAVSTEKGNYDYLMFADIDHNHPDVRQEIFNYADWLVQETKVDGFRLDAVRHIDANFMLDFVNHTTANRPDKFYIFGEYWSGDLASNEAYAAQTEYKIDLFDVMLHFNFRDAADQGAAYDLRTIFDNTLVQTNPTLCVTFVDNHDSQPGQALESWIDAWFKPLAYGLILLRKDGYPCLFFGDYYGVGGKNPIPGQPEIIEKLLQCRLRFAYGEQDDYFENPNLIGWVRRGDDDHPQPSATILSNSDGGTVTMYVGETYAGQPFIDYLSNNEGEVIINDQGYGDFTVNPGSISCWAKK